MANNPGLPFVMQPLHQPGVQGAAATSSSIPFMMEPLVPQQEPTAAAMPSINTLIATAASLVNNIDATSAAAQRSPTIEDLPPAKKLKTFLDDFCQNLQLDEVHSGPQPSVKNTPPPKGKPATEDQPNCQCEKKFANHFLYEKNFKKFKKWCSPKAFTCHMCAGQSVFKGKAMFIQHLQTAHNGFIYSDEGLLGEMPVHTCKACLQVVDHDGWSLTEHFMTTQGYLHRKNLTLPQYFTDYILATLPEGYEQDVQACQGECRKTVVSPVSDVVSRVAKDIAQSIDDASKVGSAQFEAWANSSTYQCQLCREVTNDFSNSTCSPLCQ